MQKRMGIGILGYGRFAEKWLRSAVANSRHARLVAVQARTRPVQIPGVTVYSSIQDLLADPHVEAVYVTSPNQYHEEHVRLSLEAGKHVLCEKPMALTPSEGQRMVAAARRHRRYLAVGHMLRFSPALQRAKALIDRGSLGRILYARADFSYRLDPTIRRWGRVKAIAGGGALMDGGIHCLDSLRYLLKTETLPVLGCRVQPSSQRLVDTSAASMLELPHGGFALLSVHSDASYGSSLELIGVHGRLRIEGFVRCKGKVSIAFDLEKGQKTTSRHYRIEVNRVYEDQIDTFCLNAHRNPGNLNSAKNGQANLEIIQALYQQSADKL